MYYDAVEFLSPSVSSKLSKVTIVGMKHYAGSYRKITDASRRAPRDQCLFLVADVGNKFDENAVMLHNGVSKLGHVARGEAKAVRKILADESLARGHDVVLVMRVSSIESDVSEWNTSFTMQAAGVVYERIARKFAGKLLKEN